MEQGNKTGKSKWELLQSADELDIPDGFRHCYDDLYRLGLFLYKEPELVKESIHLLFIELWKNRKKLPEVTNIKEYCFTIFKRILYRQKTGSVKHWSKVEIIDTNIGNSELITASYEEIMICTQEDALDRNRLLAVLPRLGERQRELIRMRYFEEKSIDEISAVTALAPRTIYNTLHTSLARLRELLTRD